MLDKMERTLSPASGDNSPPFYGGYGSGFPYPPWEQRDLPQVPYVGLTSPRPTVVETSGFPSPRSARPSNAESLHRPNFSSTSSSKSFTSPPPHLSTASAESEFRKAWKITHHVPDPPPRPASYESLIYHQQQPKTGHAERNVFSVQAPPTLPESLSSANASPAAHTVATMTFPGIMSSHDRTASRSRNKSSQRSAGKSNNSAKSEPLGKRYKTAFKNIFKREPLDTSQLERIEERHWTDDY